ncbi:MAG TPA: peptidylprolyl isomerase [Cyclobacteriaceae bacterium]|nr:peptidylprolyl isomerase [Cyclobacteriaceae bacterium]
MNKLMLSAVLLSLCFISGCAQTTIKDKNDFLITIKTPLGEMKAILYDDTPKHKANFVKLAKEGFYDSLLFHRIIKGFMIQGGDPESKMAYVGQALGKGGPGYNVDAEINAKYYHHKGAIAAARMGDAVNPTKASSGSQFYIVHGTKQNEEDLKTDLNKLNQGIASLLQRSEYMHLRDTLSRLYYSGDRELYVKEIIKLKPVVKEVTGIDADKNISEEKLRTYINLGGAPHLDGEYTVFGRVIDGLEVIDKIAEQIKDGADRPLDDIMMIVKVEEMPRKKITKLYKYTYPED